MVLAAGSRLILSFHLFFFFMLRRTPEFTPLYSSATLGVLKGPFEDYPLNLSITGLLFLKVGEKIFCGRKITFGKCVWISTKTAFLFSLAIEFLQLFLRLGTFQLSDLL